MVSYSMKIKAKSQWNKDRIEIRMPQPTAPGDIPIMKHRGCHLQLGGQEESDGRGDEIGEGFGWKCGLTGNEI